MNFSNFLHIVFNDWDGAPQRMMINVGIIGAGWTGIAMNHVEFNLWVQTVASLVALFILIWNFWGTVKEKRRNKDKEKEEEAKLHDPIYPSFKKQKPDKVKTIAKSKEDDYYK